MFSKFAAQIIHKEALRVWNIMKKQANGSPSTGIRH